MSWTYSNPTSSDRDAVRWYAGDTLVDDPLVTDEEIAFALAEEGSPIPAAANVCEALAAKFARQVDKSVGDLRLSLSQKATAFANKALALRAQATLSSVPYAGGISVSERDAARADDDLVQPAFTVDLFCTPGVGDGI